MSQWPTALDRWWSIALPRRLDRYVPLIADAFTDGTWMLAWRGAAGWVPVVAFVVGLFATTRWPDFHISYVTSISYLVFGLGLGIFSGAAGLMLVLATMVGDIVLSPTGPFALRTGAESTLIGGTALKPLRQVAWLYVEYTVLGLLVVRAPLSGRGLVEELLRRVPRDWAARAPVAILAARVVLFGAAMGLLTFFWSQPYHSSGR